MKRTEGQLCKNRNFEISVNKNIKSKKSNMHHAKFRLVRMYRYHSGGQNSVIGLAAVALVSTPFPCDGILS